MGKVFDSQEKFLNLSLSPQTDLYIMSFQRPRDTKKMRKNGFESPWADEQMMTWVLFPAIIIHYFFFLQPLLWEKGGANFIFPLVFIFSCILVSCGVYYTCSINPCDVHLLSPDDPRRRAHTIVPEDEAENIYCYVCEKAVNKTSKHCKFCRKCITAFDHHCKWLNTCIGEANYRYFLMAVFGLTVTTSVSLALSLAYLVESWVSSDKIETRGVEAWLPISLLATRVVSIMSTVILVPLVAMVYQLTGFHVMLLSKGLTTYDYIVLENKKQKQRRDAAAAHMKKKRDELRNKSMAAFGNVVLSGLDDKKYDAEVKDFLGKQGHDVEKLEAQAREKGLVTSGPGAAGAGAPDEEEVTARDIVLTEAKGKSGGGSAGEETACVDDDDDDDAAKTKNGKANEEGANGKREVRREDVVTRLEGGREYSLDALKQSSNPPPSVVENHRGEASSSTSDTKAKAIASPDDDSDDDGAAAATETSALVRGDETAGV